VVQQADDPAGGAGAEQGSQASGDGASGTLTLVCERCGKDYFFDAAEPPPAGLACEKCGGTVFRTFHDCVGDEAADDFRDSTERDTDPDDAEGEVMPGDLLDLNRL
jgi:hypothetical protein